MVFKNAVIHLVRVILKGATPNPNSQSGGGPADSPWHETGQG